MSITNLYDDGAGGPIVRCEKHRTVSLGYCARCRISELVSEEER